MKTTPVEKLITLEWEHVVQMVFPDIIIGNNKLYMRLAIFLLVLLGTINDKTGATSLQIHMTKFLTRASWRRQNQCKMVLEVVLVLEVQKYPTWTFTGLFVALEIGMYVCGTRS